MQIVLNGEPAEVPARATVARLLAERGLIPARVAVEVNEELVSRRTFDAAEIRPGDKVEIVTLVGGG
jgi:thiamine biosynthesis protein ThiS